MAIQHTNYSVAGLDVKPEQMVNLINTICIISFGA